MTIQKITRKRMTENELVTEYPKTSIDQVVEESTGKSLDVKLQEIEANSGRDFTTEPINLSSEVTGKLPKMNYELPNANEITFSDSNFIATNTEDAIKELFQFADSGKEFGATIGFSKEDLYDDMISEYATIFDEIIQELENQDIDTADVDYLTQIPDKIEKIASKVIPNSVTKTSKLNITAPYTLEFPLSTGYQTHQLASSLIKYINDNGNDTLHYELNFNNTDEDDFIKNEDLNFDGKMKLNHFVDDKMNTLEEHESENMLHNYLISKSKWKKINKLNNKKDMIPLIPRMTSNIEYIEDKKYIVSTSSQYQDNYNYLATQEDNSLIWLAENTLNQWWGITFPLKVCVTRLKLTSRISYAHNDFKVQYKNTLNEWVDVYTGRFLDNNDSQYFEFENTVSSSEWRVYVLNSYTNNWIGLRHIQMFGYEIDFRNLFYHDGKYKMYKEETQESDGRSEIPSMTSNTTPSGVVTASSYLWTQPYFAFDGITVGNNAWITNDTKTGWLQYEFPEPKIISKYEIYVYYYDNSYLKYNPKNWTFEGSNDAINWIILDTQSDHIWTKSGEIRTFSISNPDSYKYYRIIAENNGGDQLRICELKMYGLSVEAQPASFEVISDTLPNYSEFLSNGMHSLSPLLNRTKKTLKPIPMINETLVTLDIDSDGKVFSETLDLNKYSDIINIKGKNLLFRAGSVFYSLKADSLHVIPTTMPINESQFIKYGTNSVNNLNIFQTTKKYTVSPNGGNTGGTFNQLISRKPLEISSIHKLAILHAGIYYTSLDGVSLVALSSELEIATLGFNSLILSQDIYSLIGETPTVTAFSDLENDIIIETVTEPFVISDEFGNEVKVFSYTDDTNVEHVSLTLEVNWSPLDELEGDFEIVTMSDKNISPLSIYIEGEFADNYTTIALPEGDIDLTDVDAIESLKIIAKGNGKISPSIDGGVSWLSLVNGEWTVVSSASEGLSFDELNNLSEIELNGLKTFSNTIRFSYYVTKNTEIDYLEMRVRLVGGEQLADTLDFDWEYSTTDNKLMYYIKTSGTYSVNILD